jgi:glutamate 5-kinase
VPALASLLSPTALQAVKASRLKQRRPHPRDNPPVRTEERMAGRSTAQREALGDARRIVVKVGTRVLVDANGRPDPARLSNLTNQIAALRSEGREIVLVSSGAIAAGLEALGLKRRPTHLPGLQMTAAVGQSRLVAHYAQLFATRGVNVGQVLLTHEDLKNRRRHLNARNTMMALLRHGVVPIVNENDVVSVDEIRFSDNDHLASLVALLVDADLLLLLTKVDGVKRPLGTRPTGGRPPTSQTTRRPPTKPARQRYQRVGYIDRVTDEVIAWSWGEVSGLTLGGMRLKLQAAQTAAEAGVAVVIADGRKPTVLHDIVAGHDTGTLIGVADTKDQPLSSRKRWIAFFHRPDGGLIVDDGARDALQRSGRSLLPIGIRGVEGTFRAGALVRVKDGEGQVIARGLVAYSSADIQQIMGRATNDVAQILGAKPYDEVIHRDNIVLAAPTRGPW